MKIIFILSIIFLNVGCSKYSCPMKNAVVVDTEKYDVFNHVTLFSRDSIVGVVQPGEVSLLEYLDGFYSIEITHFEGSKCEYRYLDTCWVNLGDSVGMETKLGVASINKIGDYYLGLIITNKKGRKVFNSRNFNCALHVKKKNVTKKLDKFK